MDAIKDAVEGVKKLTVGDVSKPESSSTTAASAPAPAANAPAPSDKKASKKDKKTAGGVAGAAPAGVPSAPANPLEVGSQSDFNRSYIAYIV